MPQVVIKAKDGGIVSFLCNSHSIPRILREHTVISIDGEEIDV